MRRGEFRVRLSTGRWSPIELFFYSRRYHIFLPLNDPPGAGGWSFCGRIRREQCADPKPITNGFPFFGLCKSCGRTKMWRERRANQAVGGEL